jgi:hypothetical protein
MTKIPFNDVTPPDRRSIRNIPLPHSRKQRVNIESSSNDQGYTEATKTKVPIHVNEIKQKKPIDEVNIAKSYPTEDRLNFEHDEYQPTGYKKTGRKNKFLILFFIVVVLGFAGFIMTIFSSAKVSITPKSQQISVDMDINFDIESGLDTVRYEVLKLEKVGTADVEASGEEMIERKAYGKITVYNNYSTDPQRLITRTRFESKGLIYRIPESIVVPGKTSAGPGQIEVEIFADEVGEKYNLESGEFTIPGFKNDADRYKNFYAKTATKIEGGFVGKVKKVEESLKSSTYSSLETQLKDELQKELLSKIPDGFTPIQNNIYYKFSELPQQDNFSGTVLSKSAEAIMIIINKEDLSSVISKELLSTEEWQDIEKTEINDYSNLAIDDLTQKIEEGGNLKLKVIGDALVKAFVDEQKIAESLAGTKRDAIPDLVRSYPGIESIRAAVRPVWRNSFPDNPSKIYVSEEN